MNTNANLQLLNESDARAVAISFAQEHDQNVAAVTKLALSWFATAQLHPDSAQHATESALRVRLKKAFIGH